MKKIFLLIAMCISPALVFAAQVPVTQIDKFNSAATKIDDVRIATNTRLAAAQNNFTELYTLLGGNPWLAQTTAPNIYNVFWIDTSGTGPVLKYWDGDSWEALTFDSTGEYILPAASVEMLGGVKDGAGVTIAADGTISADDQLVGDCTAGPCLDGTSDGGNYIKLWAGTGSYWTALQGGSPAANRSWRLPIAAPPAAGTTYLMNMDEYGQMGFAPAVSDTAYGVDWNGDTGAASKNALYDKIETIAGGSMTYPGAGLPISTGTAWGTSLAVATTIGETGADTNIPTEQAVREAITALPRVVFGTGLSVSSNTPSAGTDTISVTTNTYQAYDADWLGITANGASLVSATNYDAMRALLDLEVGVDFNAYDADIATLAAQISGTITINPGAVSSGSCSSAIDGSTATGMTTSKKLMWNFQGDVSESTGYNPSGDLGYLLVYPATDHVYAKFCNKSGNSITPTSVTIAWWAF